MPQLTPQDRESYQHLYDAAQKLDTEIGSSSLASLEILKGLTSTFFDKLITPEDLSGFEELQSQVALTGGYLTMVQLFAEAIEESQNKLYININQASQKLLREYTQLKVSLEAVDEDFLDDVTTICSDPLFLGLLTDTTGLKVKTWTNQILSDRTPILDDSQVQGLINAWGTAVGAFAEDARKQDASVYPGETETIAHFFCIHDQLEGLYSELSTAVALNS
ncbi:hypothetical protein VB713_17900 [Anabaena cylindrica UHCC 0172]|uniref:hypothetical protein n=1 Tax=Anabaena cylindrica TaxID=1165 RepID=UPI002B20FB65|nr:hypothetical protein [Anabaena cylindrica]MEA5552820.1 hypothetical protein [Anabaena cylindrica UHCC 0172]